MGRVPIQVLCPYLCNVNKQKAINTMADEKIIDKIKALFRHAESAKKLGSLHEAESFIAKAQDLLLQYNIDMAALLERGETIVGNDVTHEEYDTADTQAGDRWQYNLLKVLAQAHGCKAYIKSKAKAPRGWKSKRGSAGTGVYGRKTSLETMKLLFDYLTTNLVAISRLAYSNETPEVRDAITRYTYLQSYLLGAVEALKIRVEKTQRDNLIGTQALILYNAAAVDAYGKEKLGITTVKVKATKLESQAFTKGFNQGTTMSLAHQSHIK